MYEDSARNKWAARVMDGNGENHGQGNTFAGVQPTDSRTGSAAVNVPGLYLSRTIGLPTGGHILIAKLVFNSVGIDVK